MDLNSIKKTDLGALIAGGLAFILSLFPAYLSVTYPGSGGGFSNAWVDFATLGMLLIVAATALIAVKVFAGQVLPPGVPWNLIAAAAAGLGTLLVILHALTASGSSAGFGYEVSYGPGWSAWPLFIAAIALTVFAVLGFKESGEQLPWNQTGTGGSATMGGQHGGWQQSGPPAPGAPSAHNAPSAPYGGTPSGQPMAPPPGGAPMPPPPGGAPMPPPPQQQPPPGAPPPPPPAGGSTPPGQQPPTTW